MDGGGDSYIAVATILNNALEGELESLVGGGSLLI
jgi:hypothetical protein